MLLKTVLDVNEINRNTYNTLERRTPGGLPFMKRGLAEGKRDDRYSITHVVALATMLELHAMGLEAKDAAEGVDAVYDVLIDWVATLHIMPETVDPTQYWVTVSKFADNSLGWATGREGANTFSIDPPIRKVSVNVAAVFNQLLSRYQAITAAQKA